MFNLFHHRNPIWNILGFLLIVGLAIKFWPVLLVGAIIWFAVTKGPKLMQQRAARAERERLERQRADLATRAAFDRDIQMQINRTGPYNQPPPF